jgi:hypothetical protein
LASELVARSALRAGGRQAGGGNGDDLSEAAPYPGRCRAQKCIYLSHIANSLGRPAQNNGSAKTARLSENGRALDPCRGHGENSNTAIVRRSIRSGFIAAIPPGTV